MSAIAQSKKTNKPLTTEAPKELCKDKLSRWEIEQMGIDTHELKKEFLRGSQKSSLSRYELCKCPDKRVVIREKDCKDKGQIETGYMAP